MTHPRAIALFTLLTLATAVSAQTKTEPTNPQATQTKTIVGCLTGYDGLYTIGTSSDMLFLLDGDSAAFRPLNAKLVKATGTVTEPSAGTSKHNVLSQQPPTMKVISLKKVADGCN